MQHRKLKNTYINFIDNLLIAWNIFLDNWRSYLFFLLVIHLPLILIPYLIPPEMVGKTPIDSHPLFLFALLVITILSILSSLVIPITTENAILDQENNPLSTLKRAFPKLLITFIMNNLYVLTIILFSLLIIGGIYFGIMFIFFIQTIALRNCNFNAFKYSFYLVQGQWWRVFGRLLLTGIFAIIAGILFAILNIPLSFIISTIQDDLPRVQMFYNIVYNLIATLGGHYLATVFTVFFLNLDYLRNGLLLKA